MEVFLIATAALGIVVIAYAVEFAKHSLRVHEDRSLNRTQKLGSPFWTPRAPEEAAHPVFGQRRFD